MWAANAPAYMFEMTKPPFSIAGQFLSVVVPSDLVSTVSTSLRRESIKRVEGLQSLRDGWDGYGGCAPSTQVCIHATQLIQCLAATFPDLSSPDISPSSNGTVLLTWEADAGEAVLEIGDSKFSGYVKRSGSFAPLVGEAASLGKNELSVIAGCLV
jgi:hypothetical protein